MKKEETEAELLALMAAIKILAAKKKEPSRWIMWPSTVLVWALIVATATPLAGWAVATLWGWFVVPLGLPPITWWHGAGIDLLVTFVATGGPPPLHPDIKAIDKVKHYALGLYVRPLTMVFIGWVIHWGSTL